MNLLTDEATLSTTVNNVFTWKMMCLFGMHIRSQHAGCLLEQLGALSGLSCLWHAVCVTALRCGSFETKLQV